MDTELIRANFSDADEMAKLCKKSFDRESILHKDGNPGGPQSYDDPAWHIMSMKQGFYCKIMCDGKLVGMILIAFRGMEGEFVQYELVQVFVDPDFWNKGIGTVAIRQIEEWFPEMYKLTTSTPKFSVKNIKFYEKLGFKIVDEVFNKEEGIDLVLFEKTYKHKS